MSEDAILIVEVTVVCVDCGDLSGGVYEDGEDYEGTGVAAGLGALHQRVSGHAVTFRTEAVEDAEARRAAEQEAEAAERADAAAVEQRFRAARAARPSMARLRRYA